MNNKLIAQNVGDIIGRVTPPPQVQNLVNQTPGQGFSEVLSNVVMLLLIVGALAFLFMFIFGAIQWISSGGDKENVSKARSRIAHAVLGIILLAMVTIILRTIGQVTGLDIMRPPNATPPNCMWYEEELICSPAN